jgi:spore germination protein YaaH
MTESPTARRRSEQTSGEGQLISKADLCIGYSDFQSDMGQVEQLNRTRYSLLSKSTCQSLREKG